ncbi:MAG: hypothetical protein CME59_12005 [Halioglobus sp.]|nr:hypothetical protein [Halioglobus sp.]|tara:strand:- start:133 stop:321 length:189 start_codon:yes stop_codon:yes gene_type:complete
MNTVKINASELCSRKLWQLINASAAERISETELSEVVEELARRRHYLEDLQELGKLGDHRDN